MDQIQCCPLYTVNGTTVWRIMSDGKTPKPTIEPKLPPGVQGKDVFMIDRGVIHGSRRKGPVIMIVPPKKVTVSSPSILEDIKVDLPIVGESELKTEARFVSLDSIAPNTRATFVQLDYDSEEEDVIDKKIVIEDKPVDKYIPLDPLMFASRFDPSARRYRYNPERPERKIIPKFPKPPSVIEREQREKDERALAIKARRNR